MNRVIRDRAITMSEPNEMDKLKRVDNNLN